MILLDIEGTTTPIAYVTQTLYPYARARLRSYLYRHGDSVSYLALIARFQAEYAADQQAGEPLPPWSEADADPRPSVLAYAEWLMDRDRKSPALKELQGFIWDNGYRAGELVGEVYADVPRAFSRWHTAGTPLGIFSSGDVLAQRSLFRCSSEGDLSRFLQWHFDTHIGPKQDPASYRRIAAEVAVPPSQILFLSDLVSELDAARLAGLRTILTVRPGNAPQPPNDHRSVTSFDGIAASSA
jgi:enolase-phosphatase E1